MPTNHGHSNRDKNTASLPQTPSYAKLPSDGRDIEFAQEFADQDDLQAQARSKAADERAKARKGK
ncbi:YfhD family protein [Bacillus sp. AK128]